jgi:phage/plasmid-like protein (TIGR03299 family)
MIETSTTFTSRTVPWMTIGTVIEDQDVDAAEAARLGGLDFDVELVEAAYRTPFGNWKIEDTRFACVRQDTGQFFEFVSEAYAPVQFRDAFAFMDAIRPRYVSAGVLRGGRQGFMVVQFPQHLAVDLTLGAEDDPHDLYAVLRTSHDLSKAIEISVLSLRHKCMNQLGLSSLVTGAVQRWSIRHVGDPLVKLDQAKLALTRADQYASAFAEVASRLHGVSIDSQATHEVLTAVLPDRPKRPDQVHAITGLFEEGPAVGFTGTGWGLVNAVSEYFEWSRPTTIRTDQSRFLGALEGDSYRYVNRTAQAVLART